MKSRFSASNQNIFDFCFSFRSLENAFWTFCLRSSFSRWRVFIASFIFAHRSNALYFSATSCPFSICKIEISRQNSVLYFGTSAELSSPPCRSRISCIRLIFMRFFFSVANFNIVLLQTRGARCCNLGSNTVQFRKRVSCIKSLRCAAAPRFLDISSCFWRPSAKVLLKTLVSICEVWS